MPELDENLLVEILEAFANGEKVPSSRLIRVLARLSRNSEEHIRERYIVIYKSIHGTEENPLSPSAMIIS